MKAMVWQREEGQRCKRCGTYTWEWQYQDDDGKWHTRRDATIEADFWTCVGCRDMDSLFDHATSSGRDKLPHGLQVRWFPVDRNGHVSSR